MIIVTLKIAEKKPNSIEYRVTDLLLKDLFKKVLKKNGVGKRLLKIYPPNQEKNDLLFWRMKASNFSLIYSFI